MPASYPNAVRVFSTKFDNTDVVYGTHINELQEEIVAIQAILGTAPQGSATTLKARIAALETGSAGSGHTHAYLPDLRPRLVGYTILEDAGTGDHLNASDANVFSRSITASRTFTFQTGLATDREFSMRVYLTWATAGWAVAWPAGIRWPNAQAPTPDTAAGRTNIYDFTTIDGGASWFGALSGKGMG